MTSTNAPFGLTRDAGWELGVRTAIPLLVDDAWPLLVEEWLPRWLGVDAVPTLVGAPLRQGRREVGRVAGYHIGTRVRVRWDQPGTADETVFQVTLEPDGEATIVSLRQERLADAAERDRLREHWTRVLERLNAEVGAVPEAPGADLA